MARKKTTGLERAQVGDVVHVEGCHDRYRPHLIRTMRDELTGERYGALRSLGSAAVAAADGATIFPMSKLYKAPPPKKTTRKKRPTEDPA